MELKEKDNQHEIFIQRFEAAGERGLTLRDFYDISNCPQTRIWELRNHKVMDISDDWEKAKSGKKYKRYFLNRPQQTSLYL